MAARRVQLAAVLGLFWAAVLGAAHADVDERCNGSQFACDSGQCVYVLLKCDGTRDCEDASDEAAPLCTAPSTVMRVGDRRTAHVDFTSDTHEGLELLMCDTAGACSRLALWGLLAKPKNATAKPEERAKGKRKGAAKPQDSTKVAGVLKPSENSQVKDNPMDAAKPKGAASPKVSLTDTARVGDAPRPEATTPELQANGTAQNTDVQCRLAYTASSGCRPRGEYCVKRHHKDHPRGFRPLPTGTYALALERHPAGLAVWLQGLDEAPAWMQDAGGPPAWLPVARDSSVLSVRPSWPRAAMAVRFEAAAESEPAAPPADPAKPRKHE